MTAMADPAGKPAINTLWIGGGLGRIEQLSAVSWLQRGYRVLVHSYGKISGIPAGAEVVEAADTVPFETMQRLRHRQTGSYSLGSNYFRYRLQQRGAGLWSDLDVVCLADVAPSGPVLFGLENDRKINGAILYLAPDSAMTRDLLGIFEANFVPPWTRWKYALPLYLKRWRGQAFGPEDLPWGTYGPRAITAMARKHGQFAAAEPKDVFYPLRLRDAPAIYDPAFSLDSVITPRTKTVHLWNEAIKDLKTTQPPQGSPLARLCAQFGV